MHNSCGHVYTFQILFKLFSNKLLTFDFETWNTVHMPKFVVEIKYVNPPKAGTKAPWNFKDAKKTTYKYWGDAPFADIIVEGAKIEVDCDDKVSHPTYGDSYMVKAARPAGGKAKQVAPAQDDEYDPFADEETGEVLSGEKLKSAASDVFHDIDKRELSIRAQVALKCATEYWASDAASDAASDPDEVLSTADKFLAWINNASK